MTKKALSPLSEAMLETAQDMHRIGIMDDATYEKITLRHLGEKPVVTAQPITGDEIRELRDSCSKA